jgi:UPF0716 protein FxsA
MGKLVLFFAALPVLELMLLIRLGRSIGGGPTLLILFASGALGLLIARRAGLRVLAQTRQALATGSTPSAGVLNGVLVLFAGGLLMLPGVISDGLGLLLLLPWTRRVIAARVVASVERAVEQGRLHVMNAQRQVDPRSAAAWPGQSAVIDTEGETVESSSTAVDDAKPPPRLGS